MRKSLKLIILMLSVLFLACQIEVGMGEAVDTEAPEISITSPEKNALVHSTVTLSGTCSDNKKVTSVIVENNSTGKEYGLAKIDGTNWSFTVILPEGEVTLRCTATDEAGNASTKSTKTISLLVDDTAPEGLTWYVERGNAIPTPFYELNKLKKINKDESDNYKPLSVNKDIPQNEYFIIHGRFYDAMTLDTITLYLKNEQGLKIAEKTVNASSVKDSESIYTPSFTFTHTDMITKDASLNSGEHYLQVSYVAKDEHGNEGAQDLGWILWHPESDFPGLEQTQLLGNDIQINVGSAIPFTFYDDDGLTDVYYAFLPSSTTVTVDNIEEYFTNPEFLHEDKTGYRDFPCQILSEKTENTGEYKLATYVKDIRGNVTKKVIKVTVVDASFPLLIIESPAENSIPSIKQGTISTFEIKGVANDTNGSKFVKIAYIPDTVYTSTADKEDRAKKLFNGTATVSNGEILKTFDFPTNKSKGASEKFFKESFSFDFDVLNDFGTAAKEPKFFEIMVEDTEKNQTFKPFRVDGDNNAPEIDILTPQDGSVCDYRTQDLVITFRAVKDSGLGIDESTYVVERKKDESAHKYTKANGELVKTDAVNNYYTLTIPKETAKNWAEGIGCKANNQPVFIIKAKDVLGNETTRQLSVVLSPLPVLESITSDKSDGTYKKGDEITIQAKFSDSVKVTGSPKLKLNFTDGYANYKSGTNSNTLTFSFIVPAVKIAKLECESFDNIDDDNKIENASAGVGNAIITIPSGKNLQDSSNIALDGIEPKITNIDFSTTVEANADGKIYIPADKEISVTLTCDKDIYVSGNPVLKLKSDSSVINFNFESMAGKTVKFTHRVSSSTVTSPNGTLKYLEKDFFTDTDRAMILDQVGNKIYLDATKTEVQKNYVIDTIKPKKPGISGLSDNANYNEAKKLVLTELETGITHEYSIDGGVSWKSYSADGDKELTTGTHKVTARQKDKAGNVSDSPTPITITINDTFPTVEGISIAKADGNWPENTTIDFKVFFSDKVKVPNVDSVILKFVPYGKTLENAGANNIRELKVTAAPSGTNTLVFPYKVKKGDSFNSGVTIASVEFSNETGKVVTDMYGNPPSATTVTQVTNKLALADAKRNLLVLDGTVPEIKKVNNVVTGLSPAKGGVSTSENDEFKIELTFSENVYKDSGTITLRLYESETEKWAIPPVLTGTEFNNIYDKVPASQKSDLIQMDGEMPRTDSKTGMPVGPYKKMTHGLKLSNGKFVPDTDSKYVLDYKYGIYDTGSDGVVDKIRAALKVANYGIYTLDINDSNVVINGDKVTINFSDTIKDGRHWELLIDNKALCDETGNYFAGFASGDYDLWSNYVENPVVRVDRYSHGYGAKGLDGTTEKEIDSYVLPKAQKNLPATSPITGTNGSGRTLAPLGYTNVRIDCETPGASIYYSKVSGGTSTMAANAFENNDANEDDTHRSSIADIAEALLKLTADGTSYTANSNISVGDRSYKTSSKDYITAYATKTDFKPSRNKDEGYSGPAGKEGIFKTTIIIHYSVSGKGSSNSQINIEGGTAKGGVPKVDAFPLRDATNDFRYSKNAYLFTENSKDMFAWVTYDIVTDFVVLQHRENYSSNYPNHSYGNLLYLYNYSTWE